MFSYQGDTTDPSCSSGRPYHSILIIKDFPAFLGMSFLDLGDLTEAKAWIDRAVQMGPENVWPNVAMSLLLALRGDEAAALKHARIAQSDSGVGVVSADARTRWRAERG